MDLNYHCISQILLWSKVVTLAFAFKALEFFKFDVVTLVFCMSISLNSKLSSSIESEVVTFGILFLYLAEVVSLYPYLVKLNAHEFLRDRCINFSILLPLSTKLNALQS